MNINCDDPTFFSDVAKTANVLRASAWPCYYFAEVIKLQEKMIKEAANCKSKEMAKHLAEYHDVRISAPSIGQKLESGLFFSADGIWCSRATEDKCTRIFLPAAKYDEFIIGQDLAVRLSPTFHDIPVFSYSGDEIIFCTDN